MISQNWKVIRRCQECGGEARKSGWTEDNWFHSEGLWANTSVWCEGWICEDCDAKIYKHKEIQNEG